MNPGKILRTSTMAVVAALLVSGNVAAQDGEHDIRIVLSSEPDTLDPCNVTRSSVGFMIRNNVIETITAIDPETGELQPRIATGWERIDDDTWRFELREGVTFHDGEKLDAESFIKSFERTLNPKLDCASRVFYFEGIDMQFDAVDDYTVDITPNRPLPLFPTMLATVPVNSPSTPFDEFTREPVGTGPFEFVEWETGQKVVVRRYEDYWGDAPEVETATFLFRSEPLVRAAMVAKGEADIAPDIEPQHADNPETDQAYLNSETMRLRFDLDKPPLNDIRVRNAMNLALDRDAMIGTIYSPRWIKAKNFVMPTINGYNDDVEFFPYDPERAAALVAEAKAAGVPVDTEILLIARPDVPAGAEGMQVMAEMFNAVGLNTKIQLLDRGEFTGFYFKPFDSSQPVHLLMDIHDNNSGDAGFTLLGKYHSSGGVSKVDDPELDAIIDKGSAAVDPERREAFQQAFARAHDQAYDIILFHQVQDGRVAERLDAELTSKGLLDLAKVTFK